MGQSGDKKIKVANICRSGEYNSKVAIMSLRLTNIVQNVADIDGNAAITTSNVAIKILARLPAAGFLQQMAIKK